ncbi:MAG: DUF3025 domain-containing protein [Sandaracinus sp.]|nr:DUF3025 domain-containing protein [Sandaracinus sp.]MCB9619164.1 DUF3025 domain-containing protein [Sandaracinus sp.]MCB9622738.1 DUF3025 domain-containing protein [Sandaracinus sp.]
MALSPESRWVPERLDEPPFWPLARAFAPLRRWPTWPTIAELDAELARGLTNATGTPLRFERQAPKPGRRRGLRCRDELYDAKIDREGAVPTRERSWHDTFNALVWATFPRSKAELARRQHLALRERLPDVFERLPPTRTVEQDALTLLDEGGGLVVVEPGRLDTTVETLEAGGLPDDARFVIFGHAVYEHLLSTDAPLRVGAHVVGATTRDLGAIDEALAARLRSGEIPRSAGSGLALELFCDPPD